MTALHLDKLPDETRALFEFLSTLPEMTDRFVLIGGTAITLLHGHRKSEDLDFYAITGKLPRKVIEALLRKIETKFPRPLLAFSEEMIEDFDEQGGVELLDYHQDYTVGKVKLTFFTENDPAKIAFMKEHIGAHHGSVAILSSDGLFELKSRLIVRRTKSRDLFDLWFFLSGGNHSMAEVADYAGDEGHMDWEGVRKRLLPSVQQSTDAGFAGLVTNGPQTFDDLIAALRDMADAYERGAGLQRVLGRLEKD